MIKKLRLMSKIKSNKVSIVMGSQSDFKTMVFSQKILKKLGVNFETKIISAHRTPNTGKEVKAEIIPGKWADPPDPAITTPMLFFSAFFAYSYILLGVLWADIIFISYFIFKILRIF